MVTPVVLGIGALLTGLVLVYLNLRDLDDDFCSRCDHCKDKRRKQREDEQKKSRQTQDGSTGSGKSEGPPGGGWAV